MDYTAYKEQLPLGVPILNVCKENPVDLNFCLPDYCPDIQKILKCMVKPSITSKNISSSRLELDGIIQVQLMYLDSESKSIRHFEALSPFSCFMDINEMPMNSIAITSIKNEYMNCHATSSRKIDIHGAFSICAKIFSKVESEITTGIEEKDISTKNEHFAVSTITGLCSQQFSINEILETNKSKPHIKSIVRADVTPIVNDCKILSDKVIVKGDLLLKILYESTNPESSMETMEYTIPISQIIDIFGSRDSNICNIKLSVFESEFLIKPDESGDENIIEANIKLCADVISFEDKDISYVTDAYSTEYELDVQKEPIELMHIKEFLTETYIDKTTIEIDPQSSLSQITDICADNVTVSSKIADNRLIINGTIGMCILSMDNDKTPNYKEIPIEFEYTSDAQIDDTERNETDAKIVSVNYRIVGTNSLEIKTEIILDSKLFNLQSSNVVSEISANENAPFVKDNSSLIIYFADAGESIWDIARNYHTTTDAVKSENNIDSEILEEDRMILIPV